MTIAVEISAWQLSSGAVQTLRFASEGFTTTPGDTPGNAFFDPRLADSPSLARTLFDGAATYGASRVTPGSIDLVNADGGIDSLLTDYAFDGRAFTVRRGDIGKPYSTWTVVMSGVLDDVQVSDDEIKIQIHDRLALFGNALDRPKYAGSNVLPAGLEGTTSDLKDQYKPRVYGSVLNLPAKAVNTSKLIYQVSDQNCTVSMVYDNGVALTRDADYTDLATLQSTSPAAGHFKCYQGYLRLGSSPAGQVTADAATAETRAAALMQQIALDAGISAADVNAADVAALNGANAAVVGVWADGDATPQQLLDALANSVGAWYGFDRLNQFRMTRLDAPSGAASVTWDQFQLTSVDVQAAGIPSWGVIVEYGRNYTTQTQLATSVTADRVAWLALDYRQSASEDATIKTAWPSSDELTFETALVNQADASAEATRRRALYGVRRMTLTCEIPLSELGSADLGAVVALSWSRYSLTGRLFRVIALDAGADTETAKLTLWG
jgi:hypothetical protein